MNEPLLPASALVIFQVIYLVLLPLLVLFVFGKFIIEQGKTPPPLPPPSASPPPEAQSHRHASEP